MTKHTKSYLIAWTRNVSYLNLKYQKSVTISCDWSIVALVTDRAWCERRIRLVHAENTHMSIFLDIKNIGENDTSFKYYVCFVLFISSTVSQLKSCQDGQYSTHCFLDKPLGVVRQYLVPILSPVTNLLFLNQRKWLSILRKNVPHARVDFGSACTKN